MDGSLPLYIYIYTFFCFFIYKGGKSGGFLRVTEVTGKTGNRQNPLQNGQKRRFSAGFRRYHLKTESSPIIFNLIIQHMRQPINLNSQARAAGSGRAKKRESRSPPQLVDLVLVSW
jgi:hypothetical protein